MTTARRLIGQTRYQERAACRPHPTTWWFSDGAESVEAYLICTSCAARTECLAFALDHPDLVGIWAATTTNERKQLRRSPRHPSLRGREDDTNTLD